MRHGFRAAACSVLFALLLAPSAIAQDAARSFTPRPELTELVNRRMNIARSAVAAIDLPAHRAEAPPERLELEIPFEDAALTLRLVRHSNRATDYCLLVQIADGSFVEHEPAPVSTYRGEIDEIPGAHVAATFSASGLRAKVLMPEGFEDLILEPLADTLDDAQPGDHVVYAATDRTSDVPAGCGMAGAEFHDAIAGPAVAPAAERGTGGPVFIAELACDADVEYFNFYGQSVSNVEARINEIINVVNTQYERDVNITHVITAVVVRTAEPDPYSTAQAQDLVNQVVVEWVVGEHPEIVRDVVHLFTGKNIVGSTIGIASGLGTICTIGAACVSQVEFNGVFNCATDLVAHELGHLWNGAHCDCVDNTMNPFITCANNFSQASIDSIIAHRDSRECLNFPEPAVTTFPFLDEFVGEILDPALWTGAEGTPTVSGDALNIPSGDAALDLSGGDLIRSALIPAELQDDIVLAFKSQRGGALDAPDPGDDLYVEYLDENGDWRIVDVLPADGSFQTVFDTNTYPLPDDAEFDGLRLRLRNASFNQDTDNWFIDDVELTATPIFPTDFALTSPPDGATGLPSSPTFTWQPAQFAATYTLLIDNNEDFSSPNLSFTTEITSFNNPGFTLPDGAYFWQVSANNVNGSVDALDGPRAFTVGTGVVICAGDCTDNGVVNFDDLVAMLFQFGNNTQDGCDADDNGTVDFNDLVAALFLFGPCD